MHVVPPERHLVAAGDTAPICNAGLQFRSATSIQRSSPIGELRFLGGAHSPR